MLAALLSLSLLASPADPVPAEPLVGPYLQGLERESVAILWETEEKVPGEVDIGEGGSFSRTLREAEPRSLHELRIGGLRADTRYSYRVRWGEKASATYSFRTMPPEGVRRLRIAAYGDSRSNPETHAALARRMVAADPDLVIHTGDLVTDGTVKEQWKPQFFDPICRLAAEKPLIACLGNHEKDSPHYYAYFDYPGNEAWFSYRAANLHVIVLDSQKPLGPGAEQQAWLEKELAGPDADWRVVVLHSPLYTSHPYRDIGPHRWALQDALDRGGVDLVLNGHDHFYARTHRIGRAWDPASKGLYQVTTAGGGARLYPIDYKPYTARAESVHHFVLLEVDGMRLAGTAVNVAGEVIDRFVIDRAGPEDGPFVSYEVLLWEKDLHAAVAAVEPAAVSAAGGAIERTFQLPSFATGPALVAWRWIGGSSFWPLEGGTLATRPGEPLVVRVRGEGAPGSMYPLPELELTLASGPPGGRPFSNKTLRIAPLRISLARSIRAPSFQGAMLIDGKLDEAGWAAAPRAAAFTRDLGRSLSGGESIALAWDGAGIVFGARVDSRVERPRETGADGPDLRRIHREDDAVALLFTVPGDPPKTHFFAANARGSRFDSRDGETEWNAEWQVATADAPGGWTAEGRIPWGAFGLAGPPAGAEAWRANFQRRDGADRSLAEWTPTFEVMSMATRKDDGALTFEAPAGR
jgi:predicted phosphodiesterase